MEFGVNIIPPIVTNEILRRLLMHEGSIFRDMYLRPGKYKVCDHHDYTLKGYNKRAQNISELSMSHELMRFEFSVERAWPLNKIGIYTLANLKEGRVLIRLIKELVDVQWPKILFFEPKVENLSLDSKDRVRVSNWTNPNYWHKLSHRVRS